MKFQDIDGGLLDEWVAKAEGLPVIRTETAEGVMVWTRIGGFAKVIDGGPVTEMLRHGPYWPSRNYDHGGPIILAEEIHIGSPGSPVHRHGGPNAGWGRSGQWTATMWTKGASGKRPVAWHPSNYLIAAMRCYCIYTFGDEVPT